MQINTSELLGLGQPLARVAERHARLGEVQNLIPTTFARVGEANGV